MQYQRKYTVVVSNSKNARLEIAQSNNELSIKKLKKAKDKEVEYKNAI